MQRIATWVAAGALICAGAVTAGAQTPPNAAPKAPDQGRQAPPQEGSSAAPEGSLSHELNRSGGVIHPPPTGNGGVIPPPNQGTSRTPVIPPPGSPGSNQKVEPK